MCRTGIEPVAFGSMNRRSAYRELPSPHSRLPEEHRPVLARARAIYLDEVVVWDAALRSHARPVAEYLEGEIEKRHRTPGVDPLCLEHFGADI